MAAPGKSLADVSFDFYSGSGSWSGSSSSDKPAPSNSAGARPNGSGSPYITRPAGFVPASQSPTTQRANGSAKPAATAAAAPPTVTVNGKHKGKEKAKEKEKEKEKAKEKSKAKDKEKEKGKNKAVLAVQQAESDMTTVSSSTNGKPTTRRKAASPGAAHGDDYSYSDEGELATTPAQAAAAATASASAATTSAQTVTDPDTPEEVQHLDRYGFNKDEENTMSIFYELNPDEKAKEKKREGKWVRMFGTWAKQNGGSKLKERCRKGIPDSVRGKAWALVSGAAAKQKMHPGLYQQYASRETCPCDDEIIRDLNRTFPENVLFQKKDGTGQALLHRVLRAYSIYDAEVGYCQGMGFVTGMLLMYMDEEMAFWVLVRLCDANGDYQMKGFWTPGLPTLKKCMAVHAAQVRKFLPRLAAHMTNNDVFTELYATGWFMTGFVNSLPFPLVLRVWDIFLCEGRKIMYRVAMAIMQTWNARFMEMRQDQMMEEFRAVRRLQMRPDDFIDAAVAIPLKNSQVAGAEAAYDREQAEAAAGGGAGNRRGKR